MNGGSLSYLIKVSESDMGDTAAVDGFFPIMNVHFYNSAPRTISALKIFINLILSGPVDVT